MSSARRTGALARAEAVLLRRNPSALAGAVIGPVALAVLPLSNSPVAEGSGTGAVLVAGLAAFTLIVGVYYPLVTALVARREEFVLKRLRSGEIADAEILAGTAAPAVAIAWAQIAIGTVAGYVLLHLELPANPAWLLLALAAVVAGTLLCVLLAVAVSTVTSSVETAQLTATPLLLVSIVLSGAIIPLDALPGPVGSVAQLLPLTAVVDLVTQGLTGVSDGLLGPVLTLAAWLTGAAGTARTCFRWEPRR